MSTKRTKVKETVVKDLKDLNLEVQAQQEHEPVSAEAKDPAVEVIPEGFIKATYRRHDGSETYALMDEEEFCVACEAIKDLQKRRTMYANASKAAVASSEALHQLARTLTK